MDEKMKKCIRWMHEWMNELVYVWKDRWMDGWMDGWSVVCFSVVYEIDVITIVN